MVRSSSDTLDADAKHPKNVQPATPTQTTLLQATPKSSAILSGPKKRIRLGSPQDVRKALFESPVASTMSPGALEQVVGCPVESGDAAERALAWVREGSYEDGIDETIDEDLAKADS